MEQPLFCSVRKFFAMRIEAEQLYLTFIYLDNKKMYLTLRWMNMS